MAKKGHKNTKGIPELWDEVKKGVRMMMTPTAIAGLDKLAKEYGLSRSELVERIGRGVVKIEKPESAEAIPQPDGAEEHPQARLVA